MAKSPTLDWELIKETYNVTSLPQGYTYRAKVPGGWLVSIWAGTDNDQKFGGGLAFLPDPTQAWDVAILDKYGPGGKA